MCVCPWWFCSFFDNRARRLFQKPEMILGPWVKPGMRVADIGCGMGFCAITAAELVGDTGHVYAVDMQQKMLDGLVERAKRAGVEKRITPHLTDGSSLSIPEPVDFALAMWMIHEVPDQAAFARRLAANLKPGATFLCMEPKMHVTAAEYAATERTFIDAGYEIVTRPVVGLSRAAVFRRAKS